MSAVTGLRLKNNEGALTRNLASGAFSFHLGGSSGSLMNGYLALHESDQNKKSQLVNIAGRGHVGVNDEILIAGLVIQGEARRVLIRGCGPSLKQFGLTGVLANPELRLYRGSEEIKVVDSWKSEWNFKDISRHSNFPLDDLDGAMILKLEPGNYTVHLSGKNSGSGIGYIDVSDISDE